MPGIKINTAPENFRPIKQMRLVQFDGRTWQPIGDVIENAFSDAPGRKSWAREIDRTHRFVFDLAQCSPIGPRVVHVVDDNANFRKTGLEAVQDDE